jgi:hypothetical protein
LHGSLKPNLCLQSGKTATHVKILHTPALTYPMRKEDVAIAVNQRTLATPSLAYSGQRRAAATRTIIQKEDQGMVALVPLNGVEQREDLALGEDPFGKPVVGPRRPDGGRTAPSNGLCSRAGFSARSTPTRPQSSPTSADFVYAFNAGVTGFAPAAFGPFDNFLGVDIQP